MSENLQLEFLNTELDPVLLSKPYRYQTNWHVVTGTISSGKSTLIGQLACRGYKTVAETARRYIERELVKGRTIHEIHSDRAAIQRGIIDLQLEVERALETSELTFLDRGVPDMLAWYRVRGMEPNTILEECFHYRYASVFMLDPLPFRPDDQRIEDFKATASFLDQWHRQDYDSLGYEVERIPVSDPEERLELILEKLCSLGLI